jgi:hypothetical protein
MAQGDGRSQLRTPQAPLKPVWGRRTCFLQARRYQHRSRSYVSLMFLEHQPSDPAATYVISGLLFSTSLDLMCFSYDQKVVK